MSMERFNEQSTLLVDSLGGALSWTTGMPVAQPEPTIGFLPRVSVSSLTAVNEHGWWAAPKGFLGTICFTS